jgi:hypothetical protein
MDDLVRELHMDDLDQPCPSTPEPARLPADDEPSSPRRVVERVTVERACLLCGRSQTIEISRSAPRPTRCTICGGSIIIVEVSRQRVRLETVDWRAERPRRGRPPKGLATQRLAGVAA